MTIELVFDNGERVPSAKNTKSHSRHYVPKGKDAFALTYDDTLRMGQFRGSIPNIREYCDKAHDDQLYRQFCEDMGIDLQ